MNENNEQSRLDAVDMNKEDLQNVNESNNSSEPDFVIGEGGLFKHDYNKDASELTPLEHPIEIEEKEEDNSVVSRLDRVEISSSDLSAVKEHDVEVLGEKEDLLDRPSNKANILMIICIVAIVVAAIFLLFKF